MTEHELPPNADHWPRDPYQLLGVDRSADERTVKRAYVKLIKQYKPEHQPREFALIRAAYEQIQERLNWFVRMQEDEESQTLVVSTDRVPPPAPEPGYALTQEQLASQSDTSDEGADVIPEVIDLADDAGETEEVRTRDNHRWLYEQLAAELKDAWQSACSGDAEVGYRRLVLLQQQDSGNEDLYLRLYWLLRVHPELDPQRHGTHWLLECLRRTRCGGPAWLLYRTELQRTPEIAAAPDAAQLVNLPMSEERLCDLLDVRWTALSNVSRWKLVQADLMALRRRYADEHPSTWARILFLVAEKAAWKAASDSRDILVFARKALNDLSELHLIMRAEFERLDALWEMATTKGAEKLQRVAGRIFRLLRAVPYESSDSIHRQLQEVLVEWASDPKHNLRLLDQIEKVNPIAFEQLVLLVRRVHSDQPVSTDPVLKVHILNATEFFFYDHIKMDYAELRLDLFGFCVNDHVSLEEVLFVLENHMSADRWKSMQSALSADLALRILIAGVKSLSC